MKKAIIIHGMPLRAEYFGPEGTAQSGKHWLGWLKSELIKNGIEAQAPEMLEPYAPDYEKWRTVFEQLPINENTALIGHSIGAGFLVRWLSEHRVKVGKVILVAPWLDLQHGLKNRFFDFVIDKDILMRADSVIVFVSLDDNREILESVEKIKKRASWSNAEGSITLRPLYL